MGERGGTGRVPGSTAGLLCGGTGCLSSWVLLWYGSPAAPEAGVEDGEEGASSQEVPLVLLEGGGWEEGNAPCAEMCLSAKELSEQRGAVCLPSRGSFPA